MSANVVVREAVASDVDGIHAIEVACFSQPWRREAFRDLILGGGGRVLVATVAGRLEGYVVAVGAADEAEIANLAVAPGGRRRGTGLRLVEAALADARRRGVRQVFLEVRASNVAAQGLYQQFGFEAVAVRRAYYELPTEDAVVMRCRLFDAAPHGDARLAT
ncbi:MAG: ribosomal protein S18-alanine N-acetyltransferase [Gemmatimonadota bacterium]|nr:ribosomal protein S18-alanine N-acetyltransferase [Gemmatimonadota bacterium]